MVYSVVGSYFTPLFPLLFSERPVNHPHCYTYNLPFFSSQSDILPLPFPSACSLFFFSFFFLAIKILILFGYRFCLLV